MSVCNGSVTGLRLKYMGSRIYSLRTSLARAAHGDSDIASEDSEDRRRSPEIYM